MEHNLTKMTIGVHTGSDGASNYGTLITEELNEWITNSHDEMN